MGYYSVQLHAFGPRAPTAIRAICYVYGFKLGTPYTATPLIWRFTVPFGAGFRAMQGLNALLRLRARFRYGVVFR